MTPLMLMHICPADDPDKVTWAVRNWRHWHPSMGGVIVCDGDVGLLWPNALRSVYGVNIERGQQLKHTRHGGLWQHRMWRLGMQWLPVYGADVLWKIDPDTMVRAPFGTSPPSEDIFGHLHTTRYPHVQGGSQFVRGPALPVLIDAMGDPSRFSDYDAWLPEALSEKTKRMIRLNNWVPGGLITEVVRRETSLTRGDWPEIMCRQPSASPDESPDWNGYSVVHPV